MVRSLHPGGWVRAVMTFQAKLRADFWLGGLLLALLYGPVRLAGRALRRDHSTTHRRGCVVIKLVGAGSLFLAMPSMQEIRRSFPPGRFYLVGTPAVIRTAQEFGWFDKYWTIDDLLGKPALVDRRSDIMAHGAPRRSPDRSGDLLTLHHGFQRPVDDTQPHRLRR